MPCILSAQAQTWPIRGTFRIARGARTEITVVVATLRHGDFTGRGECVPYARYGETVEGVIAEILSMQDPIAEGLTREQLQSAMKPGAPRNAIDCALWDLEAKTSGKSVFELAGIKKPRPLTTAFTLSLDTADAMAKAAGQATDKPLLKLKLGGEGDLERLKAIRAAVPEKRLIIDANEGWSGDQLQIYIDACIDARIELIEQPLRADCDNELLGLETAAVICADESAHGLDTMALLTGKYQAINIKLDKTGGLTEALKVAEQAKKMDLQIMVGCMLATSLGMAPAMVVGQYASVVDLDGPLLLGKDRENAIRYEGAFMHIASSSLWG
jgi:L-Ala-D/L-Glu epimerase / N-acetyl-D-glutamate racemase